MLSAEIIKQIRRIELRAGHQVTDALAGNYLSAFKGRGMEFVESREYVPGDDVRTIDWNVTARMSAPYVKVLREERELTIMLMVDVSPSQGFGTTNRSKREVAAELSAVLAFLATRNNDKVGLIVFSDHVEQFVPPKKGRAHVWSIIRAVVTHQGRGSSTDLGGAVEFMTSVVDRRAMCFLVSDFWATGYDRALQIAGRRHDMICARIVDPRESTLEPAGIVAVQDSESGERLYVDTSDARVRTAYAERVQEHDATLTRYFRRNKLDSFVVDTRLPVATPLVGYLRARERRRRIR